mmetsp:Transcript_105610/g.305592  ORF Transcript_105610/g.305592 Transcript_105610/m.305592 type:complete len:419 (-) Transcript_105610:272-1528(-)
MATRAASSSCAPALSASLAAKASPTSTRAARSWETPCANASICDARNSASSMPKHRMASSWSSSACNVYPSSCATSSSCALLVNRASTASAETRRAARSWDAIDASASACDARNSATWMPICRNASSETAASPAWRPRPPAPLPRFGATKCSSSSLATPESEACSSAASDLISATASASWLRKRSCGSLLAVAAPSTSARAASLAHICRARRNGDSLSSTSCRKPRIAARNSATCSSTGRCALSLAARQASASPSIRDRKSSSAAATRHNSSSTRPVATRASSHAAAPAERAASEALLTSACKASMLRCKSWQRRPLAAAASACTVRLSSIDEAMHSCARSKRLTWSSTWQRKVSDASRALAKHVAILSFASSRSTTRARRSSSASSRKSALTASSRTCNSRSSSQELWKRASRESTC